MGKPEITVHNTLEEAKIFCANTLSNLARERLPRIYELILKFGAEKRTLITSEGRLRKELEKALEGLKLPPYPTGVEGWLSAKRRYSYYWVFRMGYYYRKPTFSASGDYTLSGTYAKHYYMGGCRSDGIPTVPELPEDRALPAIIRPESSPYTLEEYRSITDELAKLESRMSTLRYTLEQYNGERE